jgi:hypothetical protein
MLLTRKKATKKRLKRRKVETVIIIQETINAEDTLFPEKVARANEIMKNVKLPDEFL